MGERPDFWLMKVKVSALEKIFQVRKQELVRNSL